MKKTEIKITLKKKSANISSSFPDPFGREFLYYAHITSGKACLGDTPLEAIEKLFKQEGIGYDQ